MPTNDIKKRYCRDTSSKAVSRKGSEKIRIHENLDDELPEQCPASSQKPDDATLISCNHPQETGNDEIDFIMSSIVESEVDTETKKKLRQSLNLGGHGLTVISATTGDRNVVKCNADDDSDKPSAVSKRPIISKKKRVRREVHDSDEDIQITRTGQPTKR